MRSFRSSYLALGVVAVLLAAGVGQARAAILSNEPLLWWDFDNYSPVENFSYADRVQGIKLYETGGMVLTTTGRDGTEALDFSASGNYVQNTDSGLRSFIGAYAIELDLWIPAGPPAAAQYILEGGMLSSPTSNTQSIIYGFQGTELEMFGRPRTDDGPTTLNDGAWHKVVFGSYGNAAGTQGWMDKLVISIDGAAPQPLTREGGDDLSTLDFRQLAVGHIINGHDRNPAQNFTGYLDNLAYYDLGRSVIDPGGDVGGQLDAAMLAIANDQQRQLTEPPPPVVTQYTAYTWAVLKDNPRFYWCFNEDRADADAPEVVRRQENDALMPVGDATRQASSTENLGQAATGDGDLDFFYAEGMDDWEMPGAWAVEMWFKADGSLDGSRGDYMLNCYGTNSNNPGFIYDFGDDGVDNEIELFRGNRTDGGPIIDDNQWHHLVATFYGNEGGFGVADRVDMAIDGVVTTVDRGGFSSGFAVNTQVYIGAALANGANSFEGQLDEVAFYDLSGLDEAEVEAKTARIAAHYHLAAEPPETNLRYVEEVTYELDPGTPASTYGEPFDVTLTDGKIGSTGPNPWDDGDWVGWLDVDPVITFDLKEPVSLDAIFIDYLGGQYNPDGVTLQFSLDGSDFDGIDAVFSDQFNDFHPNPGIGGWNRRLVLDLEETETFAQYVRMSFTRDNPRIFLGEMQFVQVPLTGLTWDGLGDGDWDDLDPANGNSRWVDPGGNPLTVFPDDESMNVVVKTDTVTVAADRQANSLTVEGGTVAISDNVTLDLHSFADFHAGTTLALGPGARLNLGDEGGTLDSIVVGDGATIQGDFVLGGTLSSSNGPGTLNIIGEFELDDNATYLAELGEGAGDLLVCTADVWLSGTLQLQAAGKLGAPGDSTLTIIRTEGEGVVSEQFAIEPVVGDHLGFGAFFQGIHYEEATVDVDALQAAAGDTDGNRQIDNADLQQILGANSFGSPGDWDWPEGDFDGDGDVDNGDLQLILGTGFFGIGPYAAVAGGGGAGGAGGVPMVVPEPGAMAMLAGALLGLLLWRRRKKS